MSIIYNAQKAYSVWISRFRPCSSHPSIGVYTCRNWLWFLNVLFKLFFILLSAVHLRPLSRLPFTRLFIIIILYSYHKQYKLSFVTFSRKTPLTGLWNFFFILLPIWNDVYLVMVMVENITLRNAVELRELQNRTR